MEIIDLCPRRSCWLENCISGSEYGTLALCKIYSEEENSILSSESAVGDSWKEAAFLSCGLITGRLCEVPSE